MAMQPIGGPLNFDQGPLGAPITAAPRKAKGGMFAGANWGSAIAAALNGYLAAGGNPAGMANMQMMAHRRNAKEERALEEAKYQNHRKDSLADYAIQQQLQQQYGAPPQPHYFQTNSGDQMMIGPDGQPQEVYHDPMRYKFVPNGMGGVVPVDISTLMGGQTPTAPVGKLTPIDEGGPTPQASGGFPRSY